MLIPNSRFPTKFVACPQNLMPRRYRVVSILLAAALWAAGGHQPFFGVDADDPPPRPAFHIKIMKESGSHQQKQGPPANNDDGDYYELQLVLRNPFEARLSVSHYFEGSLITITYYRGFVCACVRVKLQQ